MSVDYVNFDRLSADAPCPLCGWAADSVNTDIHRERCANWQSACRQLNYWPMTLPQWRKAINEAKTQQEEAETDAATFEADVALVQALFDRSLGAAIDGNNHRQHPEFREYACMLELSSLGDTFRTRFPHNPEQIAPGFTIWEPEGSKGRRMQFRAARRQQNH